MRSFSTAFSRSSPGADIQPLFNPVILNSILEIITRWKHSVALLNPVILNSILEIITRCRHSVALNPVILNSILEIINRCRNSSAALILVFPVALMILVIIKVDSVFFLSGDNYFFIFVIAEDKKTTFRRGTIH